MIADTDWAWAAGFFEGEGSVRINAPTQRNAGHLVVAISNCDDALTAWYQERWPGYCRSVSGLGERRRPARVWIIAARRAEAFLVGIYPHLRSPAQRRRVSFGIEFQRQKQSGSGNRSLAYLQDQWEMFWWMAVLNMRGSRKDAELIERLHPVASVPAAFARD